MSKKPPTPTQARVDVLRGLLGERDLTLIWFDDHKALAYDVISAMNDDIMSVRFLFSHEQIDELIKVVEQLPLKGKPARTVTCGNCKDKHASADEVRACYRGKRTVIKDHKQQTLPGVDAYAMEPATDGQMEFLANLLGRKDTSRAAEMFDRFIVDTLKRATGEIEGPISKREASDLLTALIQCPMKPPSDPYPDVPEGKYAIEYIDKMTRETIVEFWEVAKPTEGKWKGYTFSNRLVGGVGDWRRIRSPKVTINHAMELITGDPVKAAALFGYKTRSCGRCGSPLSTIRSRAAGYGETCADKVGWPYPTKEEAKRRLREMGESDVA